MVFSLRTDDSKFAVWLGTKEEDLLLQAILFLYKGLVVSNRT